MIRLYYFNIIKLIGSKDKCIWDCVSVGLFWRALDEVWADRIILHGRTNTFPILRKANVHKPERVIVRRVILRDYELCIFLRMERLGEIGGRNH